MAAKPDLDPKWSTDNNPVDNEEPTTGLKNGGVPAGTPWGREHLNWQFYAISSWIDWIRAYALDKENNLSELTDKDVALTNLGGTTVGKAVFKSTNESIARTALGMGTVGSALSTAATRKDAWRTLIPIGFNYIQFPSMPSPSTLFGGQWERRFEEGLFFRTAGGNALNFQSSGGYTVQNDAIKSHDHGIAFVNSPTGGSGDSRLSDIGPIGFPGSEYNRVTSTFGDTETRPKNITIRVWVKIGETDSEI